VARGFSGSESHTPGSVPLFLPNGALKHFPSIKKCKVILIYGFKSNWISCLMVMTILIEISGRPCRRVGGSVMYSAREQRQLTTPLSAACRYTDTLSYTLRWGTVQHRCQSLLPFSR
jgi:hypothetical protein